MVQKIFLIKESWNLFQYWDCTGNYYTTTAFIIIHSEQQVNARFLIKVTKKQELSGYRFQQEINNYKNFYLQLVPSNSNDKTYQKTKKELFFSALWPKYIQKIICPEKLDSDSFCGLQTLSHMQKNQKNLKCQFWEKWRRCFFYLFFFFVNLVPSYYTSMYILLNFQLSVSRVNVTKLAGKCGFNHIHSSNP